MLFVMGVGFLLDSPLIVFHSMCVFRLWSQCPSRCSFHMPDLCVCMAWLIQSLPLERGASFRCSESWFGSLQSGQFAAGWLAGSILCR